MQTSLEDDSSSKENTYKAFLIRIWRSSAESPWRAFAHDAESGEQRYFSSLENLCLFLYESTTDPPYS